jgi:hypothetical protein
MVCRYPVPAFLGLIAWAPSPWTSANVRAGCRQIVVKYPTPSGSFFLIRTRGLALV